jgi:hypothetical protein
MYTINQPRSILNPITSHHPLLPLVCTQHVSEEVLLRFHFFLRLVELSLQPSSVVLDSYHTAGFHVLHYDVHILVTVHLARYLQIERERERGRERGRER